MSTDRTKFFWDFFGPQADPTARHFQRHLQQFLLSAALPNLEVGDESAGPGHLAITCWVPEAHCEAIANALRPNRSDPPRPRARPSDEA